MVIEVPLPRLSDSDDEGTLDEWLVAVGDVVDEGMPVAVIELSKASVEIDSPHKGMVSKLLAEPGDPLTVGQVFLELSQ